MPFGSWMDANKVRRTLTSIEQTNQRTPPSEIGLPLIALLILSASLVSIFAVTEQIFIFALYAGILLVILTAVLFQRPGLSLILILVYVWLISGRADPRDLLSGYPIIRWGTYLFIPALAMIASVRVFLRGYWYKSYIELFLIAIIAVMSISAMINNSGMNSVLYSIGVYLRYPLLFTLMINLKFRYIDFLRSLKLFILVAVLLTLEAYFNYFMFGKSQDSTFFTVGVSHGHLVAGLAFLYSLSFAFSHALHNRFRWYHGLLFILMFGSAWIASVRSLFIVIPILMFILLGIRFQILKHRFLLVLSVLLLGLIIVCFFLPWDKIVAQFPVISSVNPSYRFTSVREVLSLLNDNNKVFFGFGPRSFSPGSFGEIGSVYAIFIEEKGEFFTRVISVSQFVNIFAELGVIGFILYWLMLISLLVLNIRFSYSIRMSNGQSLNKKPWLIVSLAFFGIWFHYSLFGLIYYDLWRMDISSLVFWSTSAAIFLKNRQLRVEAN
jgi:hypothetical protein